MIQRVSSGLILLVFLPFLLAGMTDKSKKAYELIYEDVQKLKQQVLNLEKKVELNREDISTIKSQVAELLGLGRLLQSQQASFREEQKRIPGQYQALLEKLDALAVQLAKYSEELLELKRVSLPPEAQAAKEGEKEEAPKPEKKPQESGSQVMPNLSPQEVYNMAYADYLKGNYQLAIDGFKIYLQQFPESPVADNALYWIGECYYSQREFEKAIEQFNELILNYTGGDKISAAYLKKGLSLVELGKKDEALVVFKLLIGKYPLEEEAKIAQQKIKELFSENERC